MKYWRGYLVAAICAAITWALHQFAQAHCALVDMIYPYMTRLVVTTLADWTAGGGCLWQTLLTILCIGLLVSIGLMIWRRWSFVQWLGWVAAIASFLIMIDTGLFGLNQYASPLADDMQLTVSDYTVAELNEATLYFRDNANKLASEIKRDSKGNADMGDFDDLAQKTGDGFTSLTYDSAISVFAGSTVPVKKLGWTMFYGGKWGMTIPLTGEAAVNPNVPSVALPFAMSKQMAQRMSIYSDADTTFSAFLAGQANPSVEYQYSAYVIAYHYCLLSLKQIPTSTAQTFAQQADKGASQLVKQDLAAFTDYFGEDEMALNERGAIPEEITAKDAPLRFSEYENVTDLLVNWYVETFIAPLHIEDEVIFDPFDPTQVDLSGLVNAPKK